ncbi:hypothetical protein GCM10007301_26230 [Azorhizobium oxalatiphilum]|uniref:Transmembrane protein n=1 Tax=Azorhizobium oxalatiphilum TaxID=980631 RepID=A0A917BZP8_9HYPH|nr:hypothetical protein [Azorhizobium oxalatiphilum]GGF65229.1 hypothetical protein GCM10007301_26230 [Azorhizobium oxalatiphilum]
MAPEPQSQRPPPLPPAAWPGVSGWLYVGLALVTLLVWTPLLGVLISTEAASALGCRLNEGGTYPCLVLGMDIGDLLYTLFVLGWLMLLTAPFMLITALMWAGLIVRWAWRRLRAAT